MLFMLKSISQMLKCHDRQRCCFWYRQTVKASIIRQMALAVSDLNFAVLSCSNIGMCSIAFVFYMLFIRSTELVLVTGFYVAKRNEALHVASESKKYI